MFVRILSWKKAGHMASRTERSLWDTGTELPKAQKPAGKGYLFVTLSWMAEFPYRMTFELLPAV